MSIEVRELRAGYGSAEVVRGVSFSVPDGGALAILGRNGMGKTTLVKAILGYLATNGSVRVKGREVGGWPTYRIQRLGVGYGPQDAAIFGDLSVNENLRLGASRSRDYLERRDRVLASFPILTERLGQRAGTLSGGEQKMLILARALIAGPDVLVLDEISEGLQPSMMATIAAVLRAERERRNVTMLLVEQNVDFGLELVDAVAVLQAGEVLLEQATTEPNVRADVVGAFSL
jgi:ABC-type branched-subunit amino acid transport system ATPase component